jgi:hypothetical protein
MLDDRETSGEMLAVGVNPVPVYVRVAANSCSAPFVIVNAVGVTVVEASVKHCDQAVTLKKHKNAA